MRSHSPWKIYGGKGVLAKWILSHVEQSAVDAWIEPFLGGAHVYAALDHYGVLSRGADVFVGDSDPALFAIHSAARTDPGRVMEYVQMEIQAWSGVQPDDERGQYFQIRDGGSVIMDNPISRVWFLSRHGFGGYQAGKRTGTIHPKWGTWKGAEQGGLASLAWYLMAMQAPVSMTLERDYRQTIEAAARLLRLRERSGQFVCYLDPPYSADTRSCAGGKYAEEGVTGQKWSIDDVLELVTFAVGELPLNARILMSHYRHPRLLTHVQDAAAESGRVLAVHERVSTTIGGNRTEALYDMHVAGDPTVASDSPDGEASPDVPQVTIFEEAEQ